jgi:hypothetical protein
VVFTLPRHLAPPVLQNKKVIYHLLFRSSAETLWKSLVIPNVSARKLAFSACRIVGVKNWKLTRAWRAELDFLSGKPFVSQHF